MRNTYTETRSVSMVFVHSTFNLNGRCTANDELLRFGKFGLLEGKKLSVVNYLVNANINESL